MIKIGDKLPEATLYESTGFGEACPLAPNPVNTVEAAKGNAQASSPFSYAARLVEVMLLGVVSLRAQTKIYYDAENMRVTNSQYANQFLRRDYRSGWKLSTV